MALLQFIRGLPLSAVRWGRHLTAKETEGGEASDQAQVPWLVCLWLLLTTIYTPGWDWGAGPEATCHSPRNTTFLPQSSLDNTKALASTHKFFLIKLTPYRLHVYVCISTYERIQLKWLSESSLQTSTALASALSSSVYLHFIFLLILGKCS